MLPVGRDLLFGTRWVHVFEEDSATGQIYRPESAAIPLARRPRTAVELAADGSATVWDSDAGDRPQPQPARWLDEKGVVTIVAPALRSRPALRLRITAIAREQIVIER